MTFKFPRQILRQIISKEPSQAPEKLVKNLLPDCNLISNGPITHLKQKANLHLKRNYVLHQMKNENIGQTITNKKNSENLENDICYSHSHSLKVIKKMSNAMNKKLPKYLYCTGGIQNQNIQNGPLGSRQYSYQHKIHDAQEVDHRNRDKMRKNFDCDTGPIQELKWRDVRSFKECEVCYKPEGIIDVPLKRLKKYNPVDNKFHCLKLEVCGTRADDGLISTPKILPKLTLGDCIPCASDPQVVLPKLKKPKKIFDWSKMLYKHQLCEITKKCKVKKKEIIIPKRLKKLKINPDCCLCVHANTDPTITKPLKRLKIEFKDIQRVCKDQHICTPRADTKLKIKRKRLPEICSVCNPPKPPCFRKGRELKRLEKYKIIEKRICVDKTICHSRADDNLKVLPKKLKKLPKGDCIPCPMEPISYAPKIKRLQRITPIERLVHCIEIEPCPKRADDDLKIEQKNLPKLKTPSHPTDCIECNMLNVAKDWKIPKLKKLYDDSKCNYAHEKCVKETPCRLDDNIKQTTPGRLPKIKQAECIPCEANPPSKAPKLKRLKILIKQDRMPCAIPKDTCNIDPPRLDDIFCWRPKKKLLPTFILNDMQKSHYSTAHLRKNNSKNKISSFYKYNQKFSFQKKIAKLPLIQLYSSKCNKYRKVKKIIHKETKNTSGKTGKPQYGKMGREIAYGDTSNNPFEYGMKECSNRNMQYLQPRRQHSNRVNMPVPTAFYEKTRPSIGSAPLDVNDKTIPESTGIQSLTLQECERCNQKLLCPTHHRPPFYIIEPLYNSFSECKDDDYLPNKTERPRRVLGDRRETLPHYMEPFYEFYLEIPPPKIPTCYEPCKGLKTYSIQKPKISSSEFRYLTNNYGKMYSIFEYLKFFVNIEPKIHLRLTNFKNEPDLTRCDFVNGASSSKYNMKNSPNNISNSPNNLNITERLLSSSTTINREENLNLGLGMNNNIVKSSPISFLSTRSYCKDVCKSSKKKPKSEKIVAICECKLEEEESTKNENKQDEGRKPSGLAGKKSSWWTATKPSCLEKFFAYFKARPNCPEPGDYKKKALKEKAETAAKAAGFSLCEEHKKSEKCQTRKYCTTQNVQLFNSNKREQGLPKAKNKTDNLQKSLIRREFSTIASIRQTYIGKMYQVKLSKIGIKNRITSKQIDEEPYTYCQICRFVPKNNIRHIKSIRKINHPVKSEKNIC